MKFTDEEISEGCRKGKSKYQKALYDQYSAELFAICRRYTSCTEDAQDVFQEAFIKMYANIYKYTGRGSLRSWLRVFFKNHAINSLRNKVYSMPIMEEHINQSDEKWDVDSSRFSDSELRAALDLLSDDERLVFNTIELDEISYADLESSTGIKQVTLRSLNFRAKKKMRNFLKDIENKKQDNHAR